GVSFDVYRRTTSDMISAGTTLPASFGAASPVRNFGELQAAGWELLVNYNHEFSNGLAFSATGSLADGREKITKFFNPTRNITQNYVGRYIGDIWGFETDRLFQEDDFAGVDPATGRWIYRDGIPVQNALESGAFRFGPGDIKYKDLNGVGIISLGDGTVDDPGDRRIIGNETPRYQFGLRLAANWKRVDLATYLQGVGKRQFWHRSKLVTPGRDNSIFGAAWFDYQVDYWRPDNTDAFYARPTNNDSWNYNPQTRYLLDMSYLRVKNITLGYSLPRLSFIPVDDLRVYVSGENLFTLDGLGNIPIDPETGAVNNTIGASYPYRATLSFGMQTTF
ncbi:MAG: SusC/RagA family TonB-linked outer membrane protein, partial [Longimicrobiales bacterium]